MNTPMQEMLEWVRATLPMDLDWPMLIEEKVKSLIPKEKQSIEKAYEEGMFHHVSGMVPSEYYEETYNTK